MEIKREREASQGCDGRASCAGWGIAADACAVASQHWIGVSLLHLLVARGKTTSKGGLNFAPFML